MNPTVNFGFLGQISERKGVKFLLDSFQHERFKDCNLFLGGELQKTNIDFSIEDYDKTNMISQLSDEERNKFNVEKLYDWENIIIKNEIGEISAWDAYWYQAVFLNDGYSIYPNKSHIKNKGFDGTGMHCSNNDDWKTPLNSSQTNHFPNNISETKLFRFNTLLFYRYYNFRWYCKLY